MKIEEKRQKILDAFKTLEKEYFEEANYDEFQRIRSVRLSFEFLNDESVDRFFKIMTS